MRALKYTKNEKAIIAMLIALVVGLPAWGISLRCSEDTVDITVMSKERIVKGDSSKYLVWADNGEVYANEDSFFFWKWNSSDLYGKLEKGKRYRITKCGWRVRFLSMYENMIDVQQIE